MRNNTEARSNVLNALRLAAHELTNDGDIRYERRRQFLDELENMYSELAALWVDEFEYISPWSIQISTESLAAGSQAGIRTV